MHTCFVLQLRYTKDSYAILELATELMRVQVATVHADPIDRAKTSIRKGVRPGSFIDLMVGGCDHLTGKEFSDYVKAQQVCASCAETSVQTVINMCLQSRLLQVDHAFQSVILLADSIET